MSVEQIIYTCARTLRHDKEGWGVLASSPAVMATDENQLIKGLEYKRVPDANGSFEKLPPVLIFRKLPSGKMALTRVVDAGKDYSGREGNYIAHSLIFYSEVADILPPGVVPSDLADWIGWCQEVPEKPPIVESLKRDDFAGLDSRRVQFAQQFSRSGEPRKLLCNLVNSVLKGSVRPGTKLHLSQDPDLHLAHALFHCVETVRPCADLTFCIHADRLESNPEAQLLFSTVPATGASPRAANDMDDPLLPNIQMLVDSFIENKSVARDIAQDARYFDPPLTEAFAVDRFFRWRQLARRPGETAPCKDPSPGLMKFISTRIRPDAGGAARATFTAIMQTDKRLADMVSKYGDELATLAKRVKGCEGDLATMIDRLDGYAWSELEKGKSTGELDKSIVNFCTSVGGPNFDLSKLWTEGERIEKSLNSEQSVERAVARLSDLKLTAGRGWAAPKLVDRLLGLKADSKLRRERPLEIAINLTKTEESLGSLCAALIAHDPAIGPQIEKKMAAHPRIKSFNPDRLPAGEYEWLRTRLLGLKANSLAEILDLLKTAGPIDFSGLATALNARWATANDPERTDFVTHLFEMETPLPEVIVDQFTLANGKTAFERLDETLAPESIDSRVRKRMKGAQRCKYFSAASPSELLVIKAGLLVDDDLSGGIEKWIGAVSNLELDDDQLDWLVRHKLRDLMYKADDSTIRDLLNFCHSVNLLHPRLKDLLEMLADYDFVGFEPLNPVLEYFVGSNIANPKMESQPDSEGEDGQEGRLLACKAAPFFLLLSEQDWKKAQVRLYDLQSDELRTFITAIDRERNSIVARIGRFLRRFKTEKY